MKFLLVDDHTLIRGAMRDVLRDLKSDSTVLDAADGAQAMATLRSEPDVDLVLLDLHLPDRDGLEVLDEICRLYPAISVVMLSGDKDQATIRQALQRGALGFIPKSETREVLSGALALILAGGVYVPTAALASAPEAQTSVAHAPSDHAGLTERQHEVLALMMAGKNNKMICRALGLAEPTVKNHVSAILRALGVNSRTEAVLAVTRLGWKLSPVPKDR